MPGGLPGGGMIAFGIDPDIMDMLANHPTGKYPKQKERRMKRM